MITKIIEVTNNNLNWGKFMVCRMDTEWGRAVKIEDDGMVTWSQTPLLRACGWGTNAVWILDLQTGEGACFIPLGHAPSALNKHRIWVCPMFEPFLVWLYTQDLTDLSKLPDTLNLPDAPFDTQGYRRRGM